MAKTNLKARKSLATLAADRPKLVDAPASRRIAFGSDGTANISGLLALGARLPVARYDTERMESVLDIDEQAKRDLLSDIDNGANGLVQILRQLGLLMAFQDKTSGYVEEQVAELGFTIGGIADMINHLLVVREDLGNAATVGGSNG